MLSKEAYLLARGKKPVKTILKLLLYKMVVFGSISIIHEDIKLFDKYACHLGLGHSLINQLKPVL